MIQQKKNEGFFLMNEIFIKLKSIFQDENVSNDQKILEQYKSDASLWFAVDSNSHLLARWDSAWRPVALVLGYYIYGEESLNLCCSR